MTEARKLLIGKIIISVVCGVLIGINRFRPDLLRLDNTTLALLIVAALPWLGAIIKGIKTPFFEIELQEVAKKAEEAVQAAHFATGTAENAHTRARMAEALTTARSSGHGAKVQAESLVAEYNRIRKEYKSGFERTNLMENVVARMIDTAGEVQGFDLTAHLNHTDRGWRLYAYAYCVAHPRFSDLGVVAESAFKFRGNSDNANKPFGEYWSIRAMQALAATRKEGENVGKDVRTKLLSQFDELEPDSDRYLEMQRLLRALNVSGNA